MRDLIGEHCISGQVQFSLKLNNVSNLNFFIILISLFVRASGFATHNALSVQ